MKDIKIRPYHSPDDYHRVDDFLTTHYQPNNQDGNWIEPAWEYMHGHSLLDSSSLSQIGIWEVEGQVVAVAHYEWRLGEAFFQFHPAYRFLRNELLDYAEKHLYGSTSQAGSRILQAFINDNDEEFLALVRQRNYEKDDEGIRPNYAFVIPKPFPEIGLPAGFRLTSLAEECDWFKVNRVLWRGFDHPGEPPTDAEGIESRRKMFQTPNGRMDLKIAAVTPDGEFASFCGMFYEPTHRYAYVEPVATDPSYRRLGLGKAAVLEGIRRCGELGATVAYVGSDLEFYQALGFRKVYDRQCWVKHWES